LKFINWMPSHLCGASEKSKAHS